MDKFMSAKFNSTCAETGKAIKKGASIFYSRSERKAYSEQSDRYRREQEAQSTAGMIQANEDAYFDSFCQNNNI